MWPQDIGLRLSKSSNCQSFQRFRIHVLSARCACCTRCMPSSRPPVLFSLCLQEVEVCRQEPHLFWSAGEDGMVRQYDTRLAPLTCFITHTPRHCRGLMRGLV